MAEPVDRLRENDGDYDEEADEDFNPETAVQDENLSSSEDETSAPNARSGTQKRKRSDAALVDVELDSGDEVTIKQQRKKRKKGALSEDDDAEGGFVKTRSQRRNEYVHQALSASRG